MARQLLKSLAMVLLVVLISAAASAYGQSRSVQKADVPFAFSVGDNNLPAGQYSLRGMDDNGAVIRVQSTKSSEGAIRLTLTAIASKPADSGKLVFHRYGDRYFLVEIWTAGNATGRRLPMSKTEKALSHEIAATNPANDYQRVEVAMLNQN